MGRNGFLAVIIVFLVLSDCSSAYFLWSLRKLIASGPKTNSSETNATVNVSPQTSPVSGDKEQAGGDKSGRDKKPKDPQLLNNATKGNLKGPKNDDHGNVTAASPLPHKQPDNEKNRGGKEKIDIRESSNLDSNGSCEGSSWRKCTVQKTMVACIRGPKDSVLLVQNLAEGTLKVNIPFPTSLSIEHVISKHKTAKIDISQTIGKSTKIILNAEGPNCEIDLGPISEGNNMGSPISEGNLLKRLPSYYKQMTPIYGAYLLFLVGLIVGGTWACCKFRKRRQRDGVPYQELEMGLPESASAANVESAEGWDEGWDDDWDEDNAVKSPGGHRAGSISANGLTARSSSREGWEKDWNDQNCTIEKRE